MIPNVVRDLRKSGIACDVIYLHSDEYVLLRRYVAPPAYGGGAPPAYNGGGLWGLEAGVTVFVNVTASVRVRLFCASGCYASASALFFD